MANTQIDITDNGTKTLATAGKYCDRNIDVNVAVRNGTHNRHYEVVNPTAFFGYDKYLTAVSADPVLAKVRDKKSLVVIYITQTQEPGCIKSAIAINEIKRYPIDNWDARFQGSLYLRDDGSIGAHDCMYAINDISNLHATGIGKVHIMENGDLRIYSGSSSKKVPAGTILIDVFWGDD